MKYTINILKESKAAFIMELLSSFDFIQVEPNIQDWWDELPDSVKKDHEQGEKDGEEGRVVPLDDFLKKYRK